MVKINTRLLPIKAHFFFFLAAMGPIIPQVAVLGKGNGITAEVMGYVISILPIFSIVAKLLFGYLADYFAHFRKAIFLAVIVIMTLAYGCFAFIPKAPIHPMEADVHWNVTFNVANVQSCNQEMITREACCSATRLAICTDTQTKPHNTQFSAYLIDVEAYSRDSQNLTTNLQQPSHLHICLPPMSAALNLSSAHYFNGTCHVDAEQQPDCIIWSPTFWVFVISLLVGSTAYSVINSLSTAICFDMLGESDTAKYGAQRLWGTAGFGCAALIAGIAIDMWTVDSPVKSFTPALVVMFIFSGVDILSVSRLKLPRLSTSESISKDVWILFKHPAIIVFMVFVTIVGIIDAFITYFMFWHMEEVAAETGYMSQVKLIEGCVVAAESFICEMPLFFYSGKIIKKLGYVHCMSLCFLLYAVRLALVSCIPNPWYLVGVELLLEGGSFALCNTCIVAYASEVAPPGTSATVQGSIAGMYDGLGYCLGSLIGGYTFQKFGGRLSFRYFSIAIMFTCIAHILVRPSSRKQQYLPRGEYQVPKEQINENDLEEERKT